jgi:hypothetical protein
MAEQCEESGDLGATGVWRTRIWVFEAIATTQIHTYPDCEFSVVIIGLSPSFFRFLIKLEEPFEAVAGVPASIGDSEPSIVLVRYLSMSMSRIGGGTAGDG